MAFEDIDVIKPKAATASKVPPDGVLVQARHLGRKNGGTVQFIRLVIGSKLAKAISLVMPECRLRLAFSTGSDAGLIQVSVDNTTGKFLAKRSNKGDYALTINAATADGLFALSFDTFTRSPVEALRPENGKPPHFVFKASDGMLAAD